jgi:hypothetical protein
MRLPHLAAVVSLAFAVALSMAAPVRAVTSADAPMQEAWRETMARAPTPNEGCFRSDYPSTIWKAVACVAAPARPHLRPGSRSRLATPDVVGNGDDYAAVVTGKIASTVGSFPTVAGVTSESDDGANAYSLQINSQFFISPACAKAAVPGDCTGWEQFVYDSQGRSAYIQYWLINYGSACPSGWLTDGQKDCYKNSKAVYAPQQAISTLKTLKMSGTAIANGLDTLVFTAGTKAYSTTGKDSVVTLAKSWNTSEFNIFGDGNSSEAIFNKGASIKVMIALTDGSKSAPACKGNDGTTGETTNLNLGKCTAASGTTPSVSFTESLAK